MHCSETGLSGTLICCCNTASRGCFWEAYLGAHENSKAYAIYFKTFTYVGAALEAPITMTYYTCIDTIDDLCLTLSIAVSRLLTVNSRHLLTCQSNTVTGHNSSPNVAYLVAPNKFFL